MKTPKFLYTIFWLWFIIVSSITISTLYLINEYVSHIFNSLPILDAIHSATELGLPSLVGLSIKIVFLSLILWRIVKVVVFQGSPIPWFLNIMEGRQDQGKTGKLMTITHIGNINASSSDPNLLFGAIFRAHPNSDKLIRARLEFLMITFPMDVVLAIHESKFYIKTIRHKERVDYFGRCAFQYLKSTETTSPDRFRSEMVKQVRSIAGNLGRREKRIDGLSWQFYFGGDGQVSDDFGYYIRFEQLENGAYKVTGLGPDGNMTTNVDSVDALRDLAQKELHPIYRDSVITSST